MNPDTPLYERDPEAWREHLAEGNAKQPRKRIAADALICDSRGRILLVDPKYKPDWDTPGGMAEGNESPVDALIRELREELGLDISANDMNLSCIDWVSPHGPWDDSLVFIFHAGTLTSNQIASLRLADFELAAYEFCTTEQAQHRLRPYVWLRVHAALDAIHSHNVAYLHNGIPVGSNEHKISTSCGDQLKENSLSSEQGRIFREAWINGVTKHYPGEPKPSYITPWEDTPEWERESAAAVYKQIAAFVHSTAGNTSKLTREQKGRFVALCWIGQIFKHFPNPKPAYVADWNDLPDWQKATDIEIFEAIENNAEF